MAEDVIVAGPHILDGKPCVRGTRLSVEFLLELAASGATSEQILAQYPQLTPEGLFAAFRTPRTRSVENGRGTCGSPREAAGFPAPR